MIALLAGLSRRNLIELRRYAFDTTFQFAGIFLLFTLLFWGAREVGGANIREGDTLPSLVVGFAVLTLVLSAYYSMSAWMTQEATLGTLEQIAMSPFGLLNVLLAEFAASSWFQLLIVTVMLVASEVMTGVWLQLDLLTLAPLIALLMVQMLGLSLALGGMAIVFKRVASMLNLVQFVFLAMVSLPIDENPWVRYMPIGLANHLIRKSTVHGVRLADLGGGDLGQLVIVAIAYLAGGVAVFLRMERVARDRGLIGVH